MLLLFDVDGTLVDTGGAGRRALAAALKDVTGVEDALSGVRLHGNTDPLILAEAFQTHVGRPIGGEEEHRRIIDTYLAKLQDELRTGTDEYTVLPGAKALPTAARAAGFSVGLGTGNVEGGAQRKLAHGGLWSLFDFGGYGSDAGNRADLIRAGIERGQRLAGDRRFKDDEIFVLGDTERDVLAAQAVGVQSVGVLVGSRHQDALTAAGPDLLVESLMAAALWRRLGLNPPVGQETS